MSNKAFTLLELLIVIGIIGVLAGSLAFYSRSAERQILLFRDQAKIVNALLRAKSLTISTYVDSEAPCGYGVSFNQPLKTFVIFRDLAVNPDCSDADNVYLGDYSCGDSDPGEINGIKECVERFTLDEKTIEFSSLGLKDIVYMPPNPDIVIDDDPAKTDALIEIQTFDGAVKKTINITNNGQITTQ